MTSDFRQFGICPKTILSLTGFTHKPVQGTTSMTIVPISGDASLQTVKFQTETQGAGLTHVLTLKAGVPLYGVTQFQLLDNPVAVYYFAT